MNIRENREKHFLSQQELAAMLGTTQDHISRWENERNKPGRIYLRKLSYVFAQLESGVSIEEMLMGKKVKKK